MQKANRFTFIAFIIIVIILLIIKWPYYGLLGSIGLLILTGLYNVAQKKHTILRNFPVLGHIRLLSEMIAPELHQYFVKSDTDATPIDRNHRVYFYKRAKKHYPLVVTQLFLIRMN